MVRISEMNKCGLMDLPNCCIAMIASVACWCGTKYSVCSSLPLLGVKPILKCGIRSYHAPGTPICSVQFSADNSAIGCRLCVAGFAPKKSYFALLFVASSTRLLTHTSLILSDAQSVNKLTL